MISDDKDVAETFNEFLVNIVPNLKIPTNHDFETHLRESGDPDINAINKYEKHPSIIMIKSKNSGQFSFKPFEYDDILKKVKNLKTSKASQQSDIPTNILRLNCDFFATYIYENINNCVDKDILFLSDLKLADVTPAYKKNRNAPKIIIGQ